MEPFSFGECLDLITPWIASVDLPQCESPRPQEEAAASGEETDAEDRRESGADSCGTEPGVLVSLPLLAVPLAPANAFACEVAARDTETPSNSQSPETPIPASLGPAVHPQDSPPLAGEPQTGLAPEEKPSSTWNGAGVEAAQPENAVPPSRPALFEVWSLRLSSRAEMHARPRSPIPLTVVPAEVQIVPRAAAMAAHAQVLQEQVIGDEQGREPDPVTGVAPQKGPAVQLAEGPQRIAAASPTDFSSPQEAHKDAPVLSTASHAQSSSAAPLPESEPRQTRPETLPRPETSNALHPKAHEVSPAHAIPAVTHVVARRDATTAEPSTPPQSQRVLETSLPEPVLAARSRRLADLSFRIETPDQTPVILRVREKAQEVEVTLRAGDSRWAAPLEKELPVLVKSLDRMGWSAQSDTSLGVTEAAPEHKSARETVAESRADAGRESESRQGGSGHPSQGQSEDKSAATKRQAARTPFSFSHSIQQFLASECSSSEATQ